jgi:cytochrome c-type biogenesis protein CcsB
MSAIAPEIYAGGWLVTGLGSYGVTAVVAGAGELLRRKTLRHAAVALLAVALALNVCAIGAMWIEAGRAPFKTLYETLFLFPVCIAVVCLVLFWLHRLPLLTLIAAGGALACLIYAWQRPDLESIVLPPALQSAWFVPHVVTYFVAYAALFVSAVLATWALMRRGGDKSAAAGAGSGAAPDAAANKVAIFGFVALTAGLAMGAAWGKSAWGDYWSWDVKENWAFITWLTYLAYHHLRLLPAWRGKRALWVNLACFAAAMFTYLGMHLLPTATGSLHVYQ